MLGSICTPETMISGAIIATPTSMDAGVQWLPQTQWFQMCKLTPTSHGFRMCFGIRDGVGSTAAGVPRLSLLQTASTRTWCLDVTESWALLRMSVQVISNWHATCTPRTWVLRVLLFYKHAFPSELRHSPNDVGSATLSWSGLPSLSSFHPRARKIF